ncbi:hypothetical protein ACPA9J_01275 [Pseudomonas aeruginosa]
MIADHQRALAIAGGDGRRAQRRQRQHPRPVPRSRVLRHHRPGRQA